jgi:hypothetical protein
MATLNFDAQSDSFDHGICNLTLTKKKINVLFNSLKVQYGHLDLYTHSDSFNCEAYNLI